MSTFEYTISTDFPMGQINIANLVSEISSSAITIALLKITTNDDLVDIVFKAPLSAQEKIILDGGTTGPAGGLIANHDSKSRASEALLVTNTPEPIKKTNGLWQARGIWITGTTGPSVTNNDFSFDFPISALGLQICTEEQNRGDSITMCVMYPDKGYGPGVIGAITRDIVAGETGIPVSNAIATKVFVGENITLLGNEDDLSYIVSIDTINNILYMKNPTTFSHANSTLLRHCRQQLIPFALGPPNNYSIGSNKTGAAFVDKGYVVRVTYINTSAASKTLYAIIEYLY